MKDIIQTIEWIFNVIRCGILDHKPFPKLDQYGCVFCSRCLKTLVYPIGER